VSDKIENIIKLSTLILLQIDKCKNYSHNLFGLFGFRQNKTCFWECQRWHILRAQNVHSNLAIYTNIWMKNECSEEDRKIFWDLKRSSALVKGIYFWWVKKSKITSAIEFYYKTKCASFIRGTCKLKKNFDL
jgi:hypothetical protein